MKQPRDRVIAIDYFRGLCMLIVLLSHTYLFSMPFAYLSGMGKLWVSASEMFFLISGVTFGIVRGPQVISDFRGVFRKTFRRAFIIYLLNFAMILYAILAGFYAVSKELTYYSTNALPTVGGWKLLADILALRSPLGWADFLMYFSILLLLAPLFYRALLSRFWPAVPLLSIFLFLMSSWMPAYGYFAVWQVYFCIGLTLSRFRQPIISCMHSFPVKARTVFYRAVTGSALLSIVLAALLSFNLFPYVNKLAVDGWLPMKVSGAYAHLLNHRPMFDFWLDRSRAGALRPLAALLFFGALYMFYQKHSAWLLKHTGKVVNQFGSQSLWVYIAQALMIPLVAMLPLHFGNLAIDILVTSAFMYCMWLAARHKTVVLSIKAYFRSLNAAYAEAKYSYIQRYEEN